jgi:hypothetical protein
MKLPPPLLLRLPVLTPGAPVSAAFPLWRLLLAQGAAGAPPPWLICLPLRASTAAPAIASSVPAAGDAAVAGSAPRRDAPS